MEIYVIFNNRQAGPYTLDQLRSMPLSPNTPVWYEGLADWTPASQAPVTQVLFQPQADNADNVQWQQPNNTQWQQPNNGQWQQPNNGQWQQPNNGQWQQPNNGQWQQPNGPQEPMPSTYLVGAILATIFCCLPAGIVAIIYSSKVSDRYARGDYNGARRASEAAQIWIIVSIAAGLIWGIVYAVFYLPMAML